jgi:DNA-binding HxlR family transcriptional regulator
MAQVAKHAPCAIHGLLQDLTHPWTLHILYALCHNGPARFSILRRQVDGISSRVLTERLRVLQQKGFVYRKYETTIPPAVTYGITNRMRDIGKVLDQLEQLAGKWGMEDSVKKHRRQA